jgi:predicted O-methyltransferase YrrM
VSVLHGCDVRTTTLRIVSRFRMQTTKASFFGLPAALRPEERVLELGGCLGVVSCSINTLLRDPSRHVVVEANPKLLAYLYENRR